MKRCAGHRSMTIRTSGTVVFFLIWLLRFPLNAHAKDFVVDASSSVQYDVARARDDLRVFDEPEFIRRHLPGLEGITAVEHPLYRWDVKISVPLSRPMKGSFLARKRIVNDNFVAYESADERTPDYMRCEIKVVPQSSRVTSIEISMHLRFRRPSGWQFHWLAPLLGEKFLSERVKERLEGMLLKFVENSKKELEAYP